MELHNRFDVPVPPARAFAVLRDIERIGPCMPGATIDEVDGDHFTGRVKVKIGPIQVTYRGEADYVDVDEDALSATIRARGREARGAGTADATVHARVEDGPDGGSTVDVTTELAITGKPAQFGRGVMADVAEKLIGAFADCLSTTLAEDDGDDASADAQGDADGTADEDAAATGEEAAAATAGSGGAATSNGSGSAPRPAPTSGSTGGSSSDSSGGQSGGSGRSGGSPRPQAEAIDLLDVAGAPVAQRLAPIAIGLVVLLILRRLLRRS